MRVIVERARAFLDGAKNKVLRRIGPAQHPIAIACRKRSALSEREHFIEAGGALLTIDQ